MYANIVFRNMLADEYEDDIHEDGMVENPIVPPVDTLITLNGKKWFVREIEWDYDVFAEDRKYGQIRVAIIVKVTPDHRTGTND